MSDIKCQRCGEKLDGVLCKCCLAAGGLGPDGYTPPSLIIPSIDQQRPRGDLDFDVPDVVDGKRAYLINNGAIYARYDGKWVPIEVPMRLAKDQRTILTPSAIVAKMVLVASIERLGSNAECDFCRCHAECDEHEDCITKHEDGCPFYGYDHTDDINKLLEWCKT